jgi:4-amino-4-deoxy-L-arabinose transferase
MLSWIVAPIALLSLSSGKLPTYVLPMFAPAAVLAALGLARAHELGAMKKVHAASAARWVLRAVAVAAFVLAAVGLRRVGLPAPWEAGESLILAWLGVAILAWAQLDAWAWRAPDGRTWVARNAVAPVLVMVAIPFLYPEALLSASKHPWRAFEQHDGELRSAALVVSGSSTAHAVCWTTGRHDVLIGGSPSEFDNELAIDSEAPRRIGWGLVGVRIAEERAAVPPRPVSVVCPMADAATILRATGVAAPDVNVTDGKMCIMHWR